MELEALNTVNAEIQSLGATLVAVTPQFPEFSKAMKEEKHLAMEMLSDIGNEVAAAFGIRYELPKDLAALYAKFGLDLPKHNGDDSWSVPMPARYIVDTTGVVRYAAVNADYTVRPEPEDTVAALKDIVSST